MENKELDKLNLISEGSEETDIKSEEEEDDGEEFESFQAFKRSISESGTCIYSSADIQTSHPLLTRQLSDSSLEYHHYFDLNNVFNEGSMDGLGTIRLEKCPLDTPLDFDDTTATLKYTKRKTAAANTTSYPLFIKQKYSSQAWKFVDRYNRLIHHGHFGQKVTRQYICSVCHKKFQWLSSRIQHKLLHNGKSRSCRLAQKSFLSLSRIPKQRKINVCAI